jgi:Restriction endonuclease
MQAYSDIDLEAKINQLHLAVQTWAQSRDLWYDCGFQTFSDRVGAEPRAPAVVSVLYFEGPLYNMFNGTFDDGSLDEFGELLAKLGYEYELKDHVSAYIFALDPILAASFEDYFHWQWVCGLIEPDCADVYEELYAHFARRPDDLHKISWRDFEILLFRIFQNQGFQAELGPGQGDGGVDIRLLQRDPLGDVLTLVQAKKYAPKRKIGIGAVSSLYGIAKAEDANRGMFVTTSEYLPGARRFAGRVAGELELKTSSDVAEWCRTASAGIITDKSKLVSVEHLHSVIKGLDRNRDHRVLHAYTGYNVTTNDFALVLKETKYAALIMVLPKFTISHDGYGQAGYEVPALDDRAYPMLAPQSVWRAKRQLSDRKVSYWDGANLYSPWNGQPVYFDLAD